MKCPKCTSEMSRVLHVTMPMSETPHIRDITRAGTIEADCTSNIFYCPCGYSTDAAYSLTGPIEIKYEDVEEWRVYIAKYGLVTGDSGKGNTPQEATKNAQDKIDIEASK